MIIKIKNIFVVAGLLLMSSCSNYLDKSPDADGYTDETVFEDSVNYAKFCEYLVVVPPVQHLQNGNKPLGSWDCITDNSISTALWAGVPSVQCQIGNYYAMRGNGDAPMCNNGLWEELWRHIRVANIGIANIERYPGVQQSKDKILGMCYFYRAFCYMELCRRWGGMPYIEQPIMDASINLDLPRLSMRETYVKAMADMDVAASLLPAKRTDAEFHYPSGAAAKGIKARMALYSASDLARYESGSDAGNTWENAALMAAEAIKFASEAGFEMVPMKDFYFLFKDGDDNIYTKELLWARRAQINWGSDAYKMTIRPPGQLSGQYAPAPNQLLVDCFEMKETGLPVSDPRSGYKQQNPYIGRDPRFYETIVYNQAKVLGKTMQIYQYDEITGKKGSMDCVIKSGDTPDMGYTQTGYYSNKWMGKNWNKPLPMQWPEIRMAELWLNFAEAANEAWADPTIVDARCEYSAEQALNKVRNRATMPNVHADFLTKDKFQERVRNERRVEFAFEEHRIFDLRRWKIGGQAENRDIWKMKITKVAKSADYPTGFKYEPELYMVRIYEDRNNLFVIKLDDTNIGPNFNQNPGW